MEKEEGETLWAEVSDLKKRIAKAESFLQANTLATAKQVSSLMVALCFDIYASTIAIVGGLSGKADMENAFRSFMIPRREEAISDIGKANSEFDCMQVALSFRKTSVDLLNSLVASPKK